MIRFRQKEEKKKVQRGWNSTHWVQEVLGVFDENR